MTKTEALAELNALQELTNAAGQAMIANVRRWIEAQSEIAPKVELPAVAQPIVKAPKVVVKRAVRKIAKKR